MKKQVAEESLLIPELKREGECIEAPATVVYNECIYVL